MNLENAMLENDREQKRKDNGEFLRQETLRLTGGSVYKPSPAITFDQLFNSTGE